MDTWRDIRAAFPAFTGSDAGLAYLDSAATTQVPRPVIEAVARHDAEDRAPVRRGVYARSGRSAARYEEARAGLAAFLGATDPAEVVFLRGATEAVNLLAASLAGRLRPGDEVLVSGLEHHSNHLPWLEMCRRTGARLVVVPPDGEGMVAAAEVARAITARTRLAAVCHVSNALGSVLPVAGICGACRAAGVLAVVDGAQAAGHRPVDVRALGCDFYAVSGHKMYGPDGIGALWGRRALLEEMPPWQVGGGMVLDACGSEPRYERPPHRFEAGSPAAGPAAGLLAAVRFLEGLGMAAVQAREEALAARLRAGLDHVPGLRRLGPRAGGSSIVSFTLAGIHPHDVATLLDRDGVAVRAGHHCCQPLMEALGLPGGTVRASLGLHSDEDDVDRLCAGLERIAREWPR